MTERRADPARSPYEPEANPLADVRDRPAEAPATAAKSSRRSSPRALLWWCRGIALGLGLLQAWAFRYEATPDGVSYLDVADAYREGRWGDAPNGYWSPLYSWLLAIAGAVLRLPPSADFVLAHVVNLGAYAASMCAFEYFLQGVAPFSVDRRGDNDRQRDWWILGYALFLWATLALIGVGVTTPDLLLAGAAFAVAGLLMRVCLPGRHSVRGALLGLTAAAGCLAKAAFLPISVVVFLVAGVLWWRTKRTILPLVVALASFAVLSLPYAAALSRAKGRLTFSESGPLAYAWIVNGIPGQVHWQGGPPGAGRPTHPTRRISAAPAAYEFGTPLRATYPPWYDPTYWYDGVRPRWDPGTQARIAYHYLPFLGELFTPLILVVVATLVGARRGPGTLLSVLGRGWSITLPGLTAIAMYATLFLEARYIAPFVVMVWLGVLIGLDAVMPSAWRRGLFAAAAGILVLGTLPNLTPKLRALLPTYDNRHWDDATFVLAGGLRPGDRIAIVGNGVFAYWARLARLKIVAEVPSDASDHFWRTDSGSRSALLTEFRRAGASAVVADNAPSPALPGWRIGRDGRLAVLQLTGDE